MEQGWLWLSVSLLCVLAFLAGCHACSRVSRAVREAREEGRREAEQERLRAEMCRDMAAHAVSESYALRVVADRLQGALLALLEAAREYRENPEEMADTLEDEIGYAQHLLGETAEEMGGDEP